MIPLVIAASLALHAGPHRVVDLRTHSEPDGTEYSISACARPSPSAVLKLPGHAFIGYGRKPQSGPATYLAVGHTTYAPPQDALLTYVGLKPSVPGSIEEELFTSVRENCLVLLVNKASYTSAVDAARSANGSLPDFAAGRRVIRSYVLGEQDCLSFMLAVLKPFAADGKITLPKRGSNELPLAYMRRIIDLN